MEINFNIEKSYILEIINLEKSFIFSISKILKPIFFFFTLLFLLFFVFSSFSNIPKYKTLGGFLISLSIFLYSRENLIFLQNEIKKRRSKISLSQVIKNPQIYNFADVLDYESAKIMFKTIEFSRKNNIGNISVLTFIFVLFKEKLEIFEFLLEKLAIRESLKKFLDEYLKKTKKKDVFSEKLSEEFQNVLISSLNYSFEQNKKQISLGDIIIFSFKVKTLKNFLIKQNINPKDIEYLVYIYEKAKQNLENSKKFWKRENLAKRGALAKDWSAGYTYYLDKFSFDITKEVKKWVLKEIIGHSKEIEMTERILSSSKTNNVLLVGNPGTGRRSIIEAIARKCFLGTTFDVLKNKRVVRLDLISLLSQIEDPEKVESMLYKIFDEIVKAGNVILVIEEIQNFVGGTGKRIGVIDISPILSKYLSSPNFSLIATTDYVSLHEVLERYPGFLSLFDKVEVSEISKEDTLRILLNLSFELEKKYKISITWLALREIVNLSERYFPTIPFPKKAIDILDEVCVYVSKLKKENKVLPEHVDKIISEKTEIPVGKVAEQEKKLLLNLENLIHQRIINQDEAVKDISQALRRSRAGLGGSKRPVGSFLFLGPTGVGKTETSKALAFYYYGSEDKMIRLDMSEFQRISDIPRLLGKPGQEGLLTTQVKENPFSLLLLDEIEKAHPNILNLFLQVLDEGWITDGMGRKILFTNTIIICTSNAGSEIIWEKIAQKHQLSLIKEEILDYLLKKSIFRPEFLNRFDDIVIFKPLSKQNLLDISQLLLNKVKKQLEQKGIEFKITLPLKEKIVELSYKPEFGAREMRRVIQDKVETKIARAILADKLKRGDQFQLSENFDIEIISRI